MIWQDIAIMILVFMFIPALTISVVKNQPPAAMTSAITTVALAGIAVCFATLGLWLSFVPEILSAVLWGVLLGQRLRISRIP